jgi:thioredoxin 1
MGADLAISSTDFQSRVLSSPIPVLVDFWAEWCGPCKAIGPTVEQIAQEYEGKALVLKFDTDTDPDLVGRFGINSIPALVMFKNGQEVDRLVGIQNKSTIASMIDRHL